MNKIEYIPGLKKSLNSDINWSSVEEFMHWYVSIDMPLAIPWDAEMTISDDATAICIFRKGQFQVELYLIHPGEIVGIHAHPGVEVITMTLGGGKLNGPTAENLCTNWGEYTPPLKGGQTHGGAEIGVTGKGHALLSFQKWDKGLVPHSASKQWRGPTAGPLQDAFIKELNPSAVLFPGYADITLQKPKEIL